MKQLVRGAAAFLAAVATFYFVEWVGWALLAVGAIGFVGGFFGPIVFAPEANQGPLLGIFITGPLGFVLGAVGGWVYWFMQRKKGAVATADSD